MDVWGLPFFCSSRMLRFTNKFSFTFGRAAVFTKKSPTTEVKSAGSSVADSAAAIGGSTSSSLWWNLKAARSMFTRRLNFDTASVLTFSWCAFSCAFCVWLLSMFPTDSASDIAEPPRILFDIESTLIGLFAYKYCATVAFILVTADSIWATYSFSSMKSLLFTWVRPVELLNSWRGSCAKSSGSMGGVWPPAKDCLVFLSSLADGE